VPWVIITPKERNMGMNITAENRKVGDITVAALKKLIRDAVSEMIDPDYGLNLRPEVVARLRASAKQKEQGKGISLDKVKKTLGLK
jgi:hypothetical protein